MKVVCRRLVYAAFTP
nr:hypothetical protein [Vibrio mimicus]